MQLAPSFLGLCIVLDIYFLDHSSPLIFQTNIQISNL